MKKIAVITGASSGMGREFVYAIDKDMELDELWVIARREERLLELQARRLHIGNIPRRAAVFERLRHIFRVAVRLTADEHLHQLALENLKHPHDLVGTQREAHYPRSAGIFHNGGAV